MFFSETLSGKTSPWHTILIRAPKSQLLQILGYVFALFHYYFTDINITPVFISETDACVVKK